MVLHRPHFVENNVNTSAIMQYLPTDYVFSAKAIKLLLGLQLLPVQRR